MDGGGLMTDWFDHVRIRPSQNYAGRPKIKKKCLIGSVLFQMPYFSELVVSPGTVR